MAQTGTPTRQVPPTAVSDVRGLVCPFSLITVRKALNKISSGDTLAVISDHPETYNETIPRMCDAEGHVWERSESDPGVYRILVRKK